MTSRIGEIVYSPRLSFFPLKLRKDFLHIFALQGRPSANENENEAPVSTRRRETAAIYDPALK